jgi:hypothetical protein
MTTTRTEEPTVNDRPRPDCYPTYCEPGAACPRHAQVANTAIQVSDLTETGMSF